MQNNHHVNPYQNSKFRSGSSGLSPKAEVQRHHGEYVIPRQMWDFFARSFMSGKTGFEKEKMTTTAQCLKIAQKVAFILRAKRATFTFLSR